MFYLKPKLEPKSGLPIPEFLVITKVKATNQFMQTENIRKKMFWKKDAIGQGCNARKVNCSCVYSAYILKIVLPGRNL